MMIAFSGIINTGVTSRRNWPFTTHYGSGRTEANAYFDRANIVSSNPCRLWRPESNQFETKVLVWMPLFCYKHERVILRLLYAFHTRRRYELLVSLIFCWQVLSYHLNSLSTLSRDTILASSELHGLRCFGIPLPHSKYTVTLEKKPLH